VIGLGTIEMRKGIDLFIECAAAIVRSGRIKHCRFVWIGYGYNINDLSYSFFLHEQIKRSGLVSNVFIIDAVPDLKIAYEAADIVLISSRLDPLPNVGIDAMFYKKPLICFDKATGLADILIKNNLGNECVSEYMDTMNMANKLMNLAQSESLRQRVGLRLEQIANEFFDFEKYALQIEKIGLDAVQYYNQQQRDAVTIMDSGIVSLDYFLRPDEKMEIKAAVTLYVRAWASQNVRRKLFAGFHPGIFMEQSQSYKPDGDPLAQFITQGRPAGPWSVKVITSATKPTIIPDSLRIALHIHVYYPELLLKILKRLNRNEISPDLFISVSDQLDLKEIHEILSYYYKGKVIQVQSVPNKGRDIGPFFTAFGTSFVNNYDIIGHIHTKKTKRIPNETFGTRWFEFLLDNLIGGRHNLADIILSQMASNPLIGLVFPDDPHVLGWDLNKGEAEKLRLQMGLKELPENIWFPMGTMFWARTESLLPLFNIEIDWEMYPDEPIPEDGTILHALERILPLVVSHQGFQIAVTNVEGVNR
ncbi:MAG: rhamnan synthesis F family protein, partial [Saprospiraceae bacterium]